MGRGTNGKSQGPSEGLPSRCASVARARRVAPRELEVMTALVEGLTEDEIANQLEISRHTVHTHVRNLYLKLDVHSRVELLWRVINHPN